MGKGWIWILVIVVLVALALIVFFVGNSGNIDVEEGSAVDPNIILVSDEEFIEVDSTDEILNEIEDSLEYFE